MENAMDMAQFISASFQSQDYYCNAWVKADKTGIEMTLFNELGAAMGELSYLDGLVHFSSPVFPKSIKPEYIVADFQLCFYNPMLLGKALENCGLALAIDGTVRRILKGESIIIEIEKEDNTVHFTNFLRGYRYTLEGNFKEIAL